MKVSLLYNADAGDGRALNAIEAALATHRHELVCLVKEKACVARLFEQPCDLVVAAGGDGTVGALARAVETRDVPIGILPLGTANNVARTFGIEGSIENIVEHWDTSRWRQFDLGVAQGEWGTRIFVESVGVGLMPEGIDSAHTRAINEVHRYTSSLARTAHIFRDALAQMQPDECTVTVDGRSISGAFFLIEVLNIPFVGPNLVFAADTNPSDGFFDVVLAQEEQRQHLDDYLRHRMEGTDCPVSLPTVRGRRVEIENPGRSHVDDRVYNMAPRSRVALEIKTRSLRVLV